MSDKWFTCQQLADLGLETLPNHRVNVLRMAEREGWHGRHRSGQGGGLEYHITSLPEAARIELASRSLHLNSDVVGMSRQGSSSIPATAGSTALSIPQNAEGQEPATQYGAVPPGAGRSPATDGSDPRTHHAKGAAPGGGRAATRAAARLVIVNLVKAFKEEGGLSMVAARSAFTSLFNAGEVPVEDWIAKEVGKLSIKSIERWQSTVAREGVKTLGGRYGNRKGKGQIEGDPEILDFALALMHAFPHLTAKKLGDGIEVRFGKKIPKRTVQRFMATAREKYAQAFLAVGNPDAWKNKHLAAFGSASEKVFAPNDLWELDASPVDALCVDPDDPAKTRRYHLIGCIDVWTRRAQILVSEVPKSTATLALMRKSIMDWGSPKKVGTDNGADFKSAHVAHALGALLIEQKLCAPFTPEGKPHIERFFRTLQHDLLPTLPGYVGHNVEDRKAIESRKAFAERLGDQEGAISVELTPDELQDKIDEWIEYEYHRREHGSLGTSPRLKLASYQGSIERIEDERALDVLLMPMPGTDGMRVVGKKGIRLQNTIFVAPQLGAHIGERVQVRLDPADIGRIVVYSADYEFICVAQAPERTGISMQELATATKVVNKEHFKALRREEARRRREQRVGGINDEIMAHLREKADAETIIPFSQKSTSYSTPALEAASDAARAIDDPEPPRPERPDDAELAREAHEALVIDMPDRRDAPPDDPWQWFQWARDNYDRLNDIQKENFHELEHDPVIRIYLADEAEKQSS